METTEKIVEAYVRYVRGWLTIPNIKCKGQLEIDLLAVDVTNPTNVLRYHIESGVSISGGFSKLTNKKFSPEKLKKNVEKASQRRTLGYFLMLKFTGSGIVKKLKEFGFNKGNYNKVIVSWGWEDDVPVAAKKAGVELWDFKNILGEMVKMTSGNRTYFIDDTMRTVQLLAKALDIKVLNNQ